jgi:hypothetical protein
MMPWLQGDSGKRWLVSGLWLIEGASAAGYLFFLLRQMSLEGHFKFLFLQNLTSAAPGLVLGLVWYLGKGAAGLGHKVFKWPLASSRLWSALCGSPLSLLWLGVFFQPLFNHWGGKLSLDILGNLQLPGMRGFFHLSPAVYLQVLWAGPWLCLSLFLFWISGFWRYTRSSGAIQRPIPRGWQLFGLALVFYLALGTWTTLVYPATGDEPHYLLITHSLIHDHDLNLANNMAHHDFLDFYPSPNLDFHPAPSPAGQMISKHFPLLSVGLIPGYALLGRFGAAATIMLMAAGICVLLFKTALRLDATPTQAIWVFALAVASPPLAVYFDLIYYELPGALILLGGMYFWLRGGRAGLFSLALAAVLLPWLHLKYIPVSLFLGGLLFLTPRIRYRDLVLVLALAGLAALGFFAFFHAHYQFSVADNPYGRFSRLISEATLINALGIWVDRDFGILASAPLLLLMGLLGFLVTSIPWRARLFMVGIFCIDYILVARFDFTGSVASFSRHMIPASLLFWPLVPWGWKAVSDAWKKGRRRSGGGVALRWPAGVALFGAETKIMVAHPGPGAVPVSGIVRTG